MHLLILLFQSNGNYELVQIILEIVQVLLIILGALFIVFKTRVEKRKELGIKISEIISNNIFECTLLIEKIRFELCLGMETELDKKANSGNHVDNKSFREISLYQAKWYYHSSILPNEFSDLKDAIEGLFVDLNEVLRSEKSDKKAFKKYHELIIESQKTWNNQLTIWGKESQKEYSLSGILKPFRKN